jgi:hypothetical protein
MGNLNPWLASTFQMASHRLFRNLLKSPESSTGFELVLPP